MRYVVSKVEDIPPGARKIVEAGGRSIGIFNLGGEFFALRNRCPHAGAELCRGRVWGRLTASEPGEFTYVAGGEILTCPHHGWEFEIRTGRSWCEPNRLRVTEYPVSVASGEELSSELSPSLGGAAPQRIEGTVKAETIEVDVEGDYLVVELA
jgi:3-phenylpropionate/trans-cinnamate dioxygenase ferredoxin subunit